MYSVRRYVLDFGANSIGGITVAKAVCAGNIGAVNPCSPFVFVKSLFRIDVSEIQYRQFVHIQTFNVCCRPSVVFVAHQPFARQGCLRHSTVVCQRGRQVKIVVLRNVRDSRERTCSQRRSRCLSLVL